MQSVIFRNNNTTATPLPLCSGSQSTFCCAPPAPVPAPRAEPGTTWGCFVCRFVRRRLVRSTRRRLRLPAPRGKPLGHSERPAPRTSREGAEAQQQLRDWLEGKSPRWPGTRSVYGRGSPGEPLGLCCPCLCRHSALEQSIISNTRSSSWEKKNPQKPLAVFSG